MKFHGTVVKKAFAKGTKSEHAAVSLETDSGSYVLRRQGGNAFSDSALDKLVGKRIVAEGAVTGYTLIMTSWREA
jgi:hypothetical protein